MKIFNKYIIVFALVFAFTSCEDFVGGDINADPNNPTSVPVSAQLPAFQIAVADVYGGAFSRFNSMLCQQVEGVARQWSSFNQYTGLTPNRFDAAWTNVYENVLNEIHIARTTATTDGNNHYNGILNVTEAFILLASADVWDDMPYSQALLGIDNTSPAYDSQADIYSAAMGLLDSGISLLNGPAGPVSPGGDDVIYGGDVATWVKAANAIKARALLNQDNYTGAMTAAMASFESAADNMAYQYPDANAAGQWYRFNRDRTGDLEFHPQFASMLTGLNDTLRLNLYSPTFVTTHPYLVPNFLQEMVTYREMQFVIAECALRAGDNATAHAAYLNGINASFARAGLDATDYVAQSMVDPGMGGLTLEHVYTQKYIGLYLQPQVYNDFRRTGFPDLAPVSGTAVPVRWDYSSDEYLFNSNSPAEGSVNIYTDRVGWNR